MKKLITVAGVVALISLLAVPTFAGADECQTCTYQNCGTLMGECSKLYGCPHTVACIGACSTLLKYDGSDWTPESFKAYNTCCDNCAWKNYPLQSRIKACDVLTCQSHNCNKQCS